MSKKHFVTCKMAGEHCTTLPHCHMAKCAVCNQNWPCSTVQKEQEQNNG